MKTRLRLAGLLCATHALAQATAPAAPVRAIAPGPFQPSWESLQQHYRTPEWFRDGNIRGQTLGI